jgi:hypothetical protein
LLDASNKLTRRQRGGSSQRYIEDVREVGLRAREGRGAVDDPKLGTDRVVSWGTRLVPSNAPLVCTAQSILPLGCSELITTTRLGVSW